MGTSVAKDLTFTGRIVDAAEAESIGLVDEVVADDEVFSSAVRWAKQFVGGPALALRAAKKAIDTGGNVDLGTGLALERSEFAALFATSDRTEGMGSFVTNGPGKASFTGS